MDVRKANRLKRSAKPAAKADFNNKLAHLKIRYKLPGKTESKLISLPIQKANKKSSEALFATSVVAFAGGLIEIWFSFIIHLQSKNSPTIK